MIVHRTLEQGSREWLALRAGKVTASDMHVLMTEKARAGALTVGSRTYLYRLLAEWALGEPYETGQTGFMARGSELEDRAWATYAFDRRVEVEKVGGVENDERTVWCSPDRLIGADGGGELKILSAPNHIGVMLDGPDRAAVQVQANLWITERSWWDLYFWNPVLPEVCVRVERDDDLIATLASSVGAFLGHLEAGKARLREFGVMPPAPVDRQALSEALKAEGVEFDRLVAEAKQLCATAQRSY